VQKKKKLKGTFCASFIMLYLIGLGLNSKSISIEALDAIRKIKEIYLEEYTVDFPYSKTELEEVLGKKIISKKREGIENLEILIPAKEKNVALLIYGSPLIATTHISIIAECLKEKIKYKIIDNASILDAITQTGLQIYKFGKITSMPLWKKNYEPESFIEILKGNRSISAHTLLLIDLGLEIKEAIRQLEIASKKNKFDLDKIVVCSRMGTKDQKIYFNKLDELKKIQIKRPYCFIIPEKMHFLEKEILEKMQTI